MEQMIKELTMQEKIGQMIIVGMDSNYITDRIKNLILKYKIGGLILYRKNFKTYQDMIKLINDLNELNSKNKIPLFISIDQEGGRVNRMPSEFENLPAANKIANTKDLKLVSEAASITGEILSGSGINMDFAPVLDIKRFKNNHAIGDRCFGDNVDDIIVYGITTMKMLQEKKVIPVVKHFPGHGATTRDSHYFLPIINKKIDKLENEDMKPFEEAIKKGADAIMVGHLLIRGETNIYPASLSKKFIVKYLRKKYRFRGLIITDDLKMRAIRFMYGSKLAVKKAFMSGSDIIVFRFGRREEEMAINQIYKLVKNGKMKEADINRSVNRIIKIKQKYGLFDRTKVKGVNSIEDINKRIDNIRKIVL